MSRLTFVPRAVTTVGASSLSKTNMTRHQDIREGA